MNLIATENQQVLNQMYEYWYVLEKFDELTHNIQIDHNRLNLAHEYSTNQIQSIKRLSHMLNKRSCQAHPRIQVVYFKKQSQTLHDYANAALAECNHLHQPTKNPIEKFFSLDQTMTILDIVNGNLKLTPFTLKQQSKIDPFDDLLRLNLWLNSYSLFIF